MAHHDQFLHKSLHDLVERYQQGLAFLLNIESKCKDAIDDVALIRENIETIRSNEK